MIEMYYKLDENKNVTPCSDEEWLNFRKETLLNNCQHVADDIVNGKRISTIFLGLHIYVISEIPMVFETIIFDDGHIGGEIYRDRYSTWEQAEEGHKRAIQWVKNGCKHE